MPTTVNGSSSASNSYNAVFAKDSDNSKMKPSDFLKLFVTQLQNQDFNDPMDNSEMMNQITQLSNMQNMQEMASFSKSGYAMSLVGKTVTASRYNVSGTLDTTTGPVSKVSLVDGEYLLYVNGKKYSLEQIMEIKTDGDKSPSMDVSTYPVKATSVTDNTATVKWSVPTEDSTEAKGLTYSVYYSTKGPFKTVAEVEGGTRYGAADQKNLLGETITGLESGQAYFVNVVVKDAEGKKYVYTPTMVVTNK